ncbi:BCL2/adenovirus E1B 19 kDa protein-interacting protein 3 isoform 1, partial [Tropilaelaps mercedesae]
THGWICTTQPPILRRRLCFQRRKSKSFSSKLNENQTRARSKIQDTAHPVLRRVSLATSLDTTTLFSLFLFGAMHTQILPHKDTAEWIWDWSGRPESAVSARDLKYGQSGKANLSLRHSRVIRKGVISEMLPLFVFSNLLSIILGAGIGLFFGKRWSAARNLSVIGLD